MKYEVRNAWSFVLELAIPQHPGDAQNIQTSKYLDIHTATTCHFYSG
jgi:hypothetical protein